MLTMQPMGITVESLAIVPRRRTVRLLGSAALEPRLVDGVPRAACQRCGWLVALQVYDVVQRLRTYTRLLSP